jgi:hypothetical protein
MIQVSLLAKMECHWLKSSINRCLQLSSKTIMEMSKTIMDKKWWMIKIKCICINKDSKKILLKIRLTKLLKYAQKMMLFLEILNSQPMKLLSIMILKIHQSMQLTYRLLNGKDHKRLLLKENLKCIEIKWVQEILNKEF